MKIFIALEICYPMISSKALNRVEQIRTCAFCGKGNVWFRRDREQQQQTLEL